MYSIGLLKCYSTKFKYWDEANFIGKWCIEEHIATAVLQRYSYFFQSNYLVLKKKKYMLSGTGYDSYRIRTGTLGSKTLTRLTLARPAFDGVYYLLGTWYLLYYFSTKFFNRSASGQTTAVSL